MPYCGLSSISYLQSVCSPPSNHTKHFTTCFQLREKNENIHLFDSNDFYNSLSWWVVTSLCGSICKSNKFDQKTTQHITYTSLHTLNCPDTISIHFLPGLTNQTSPLCRAGRPGHQRLGVCKEARHCRGGHYQGFCHHPHSQDLGVCCFGKNFSLVTIWRTWPSPHPTEEYKCGGVTGDAVSYFQVTRSLLSTSHNQLSSSEPRVPKCCHGRILVLSHSEG